MANSSGGGPGVVPQSQPQPTTNASAGGGLTCSHCGLIFDSSASLQVHMHYHHENQANRWTNSTTPTSTNHNNSSTPPDGGAGGGGGSIDLEPQQAPLLKHNIQQITNQKSLSPPSHNHHNINNNSNNSNSNSGNANNMTNNNTIAAADSSDNQPSTPNSDHHIQAGHESVTSANGSRNTPASYHTDMNNYYMQQPPLQPHYDPQYQQTAVHYGNMDYGQVQPGNNANNSNTASNNNPNNSNGNNNLSMMQQPTQEYKAVPSSRYHPYNHISSNTTSSNSTNNGSGVNTTAASSVTSTTPVVTTNITAAVTANHHNISPRIVSSSSPNVVMPQHLGQPTPSPSPKQCDKCGMVCTTVSELNDHYATMHPGELQHPQHHQPHHRLASRDYYSSNYGSNGSVPSAGVKEEPACDILDLDSQKMVYPHHQNNNDPSMLNNNQLSGNEGPLPSMQSLHAMQRHPMLWHHPPPATDSYMQPNLLHHHQQQANKPLVEYSMMSPVMKSEYTTLNAAQTHLSSSPSSGGLPSIKSEYMGLGSGPGSDMKSTFDQSSITTSPPDFPTTTTPLDSTPNGQFRSFEPASSSLPTANVPNSVGGTKGSSWKSNEARRPKTYNCTACNKWFTSSGHLKRHYNTTLHKNAVKTSGQPDPATMPISVHHHPSRDPNSKHHRNNSNAAGIQQQVNQPPPPQPPPPDPQSRSPEYTPQYTGTNSGYHGVVPPPPTLSQGFQQYGALHSNASNPPNEQAGPSVLASQPRGLLIYSSNNNNSHSTEMEMLDHQQPHHHLITSNSQIITAPSIIPEEPLSHHNPTIIPSLHSITTTTPLQPQSGSIMEGLRLVKQEEEDPAEDYTSNITSSHLATLTTITPTTISPHSMHPSSQLEPIIPPLQSYPIITGNHHSEHDMHHPSALQAIPPPQPFEEFMVAQGDNEDPVSTTIYTIRYFNSNDVGDTAPPFSPDVPDQYQKQYTTLEVNYGQHQQPQHHHHHHHYGAPVSSQSTHREEFLRPLTPKQGATAPDSPSPSSPSVTSSDPMHIEPDSTPSIPLKAKSSDSTVKHRCEQCDKVFNKSCYLTQHNKTFHSGEKPFKCQRCGKRFPCDQSHEEHVAKHGGDKPFKCELCPKAFNHKTDLRRHMCLHSGSKPYNCETCGKGFIRKDHLVKHHDVHRRKTESMKRKMVSSNVGKGEKGTVKRIKSELMEDEDDDNSLMEIGV